MTEAVLLAACRTAIGTARKGTLRDTGALDLATVVVREAVRRSGLPPESLDDVILERLLGTQHRGEEADPCVDAVLGEYAPQRSE
ncbi:hypothetical protein ABZ896_24605, partial [Streptomyces sp. NPDC047072]